MTEFSTLSSEENRRFRTILKPSQDYKMIWAEAKAIEVSLAEISMKLKAVARKYEWENGYFLSAMKRRGFVGNEEGLQSLGSLKMNFCDGRTQFILKTFSEELLELIDNTNGRQDHVTISGGKSFTLEEVMHETASLAARVQKIRNKHVREEMKVGDIPSVIVTHVARALSPEQEIAKDFTALWKRWKEAIGNGQEASLEVVLSRLKSINAGGIIFSGLS